MRGLDCVGHRILVVILIVIITSAESGNHLVLFVHVQPAAGIMRMYGCRRPASEMQILTSWCMSAG